VRVTIDIPDHLAEKFGATGEDLARLLERRLRQPWSDNLPVVEEVTAFLARGPQPEEIVAFRPSEKSIERARELLQRNRNGTLTSEEVGELDTMETLNHLFALIKANAWQRLAMAS
jgi:hypothetical protein